MFKQSGRKLLPVAALAWACCAAPDCGGDDLAQARPATQSTLGDNGVIEIGDADNGGKKELRVGDLIEVSLPENPTTGYRWQLHSPVSPVLEAEADTFAGPQSGLIGAGGVHRWRFKAVKAGVVRLTIDSRRSWEPAPVATFAVTIDAAP